MLPIGGVIFASAVNTPQGTIGNLLRRFSALCATVFFFSLHILTQEVDLPLVQFKTNFKKAV